MAMSRRRTLPFWVWLLLGAVAGACLVVMGQLLWQQVRPASQAPEAASMLPPPQLVARPEPVSSLPPVVLEPLWPPFGVSDSVHSLAPTEYPLEAVVSVSVPPAAMVPSPGDEVAHAQPTGYPEGPGQLVLVIDDMGLVPQLSARAMAVLPSPTVLSFLAYGPATAQQAEAAKLQGFTVYLHLPMEPQPHANGTPEMGPHGLKVGMSSETLVQLVRQNLQALPQAEGVNNHMGSRFTQWEAGMRVVLEELAARNLPFLDSRTAAPTATRAAAQGLNLQTFGRDVFLDHVPTEAAVRDQLRRAVQLAQRSKRPIIVIGHPLPATLDVLEADLPLVQAAGVAVVRLQAAK